MFVLIALITFSTANFAQSSKFKVVLDAGHGGRDIGATYHGYAEKDIALNVTLKVGKILMKHSNIEVIYTRDSDVFVELNKRASIANKNNASIFVSIHCNANVNTAAEGYETYVMGMHRNASNLEVAKFENEVVTLEKDYKFKYNGYDPKSPESAIGTTLMQEEYMDNSIALASRVQNGLATNFGRKDRRVKQAGFLVLREIYMPRILIEMGFISNKREGAYMNSEEGQNEMANGIANAIISYKNEFYGSGGGSNDPIEKPTPKTPEKVEPIVEKVVVPESKPTKPTEVDTNENQSKGIVFKVQIAASGKNLELTPSNFKGLNNISMISENGTLYKYMYGNASNYNDAKKDLAEAKAKGFEGAYIIAFKDGKKINLQEALK
ncbi:N-acetylmuramoyl-L-alanine amidase [Flavobacterium sp.]|uniref:N-acetylmuramoyl-L-alanine amidase n=1 Tax=Flavobacterium sp. TaxID=239 RepID=UPI0026206CCD|nr:N-acetylmuramoyl-L-alanine amidase [Flavobacterium sp.]MDD3004080.1 N-acetylmuramoyl-L-alanine amidase [Flavobacterium sp.]